MITRKSFLSLATLAAVALAGVPAFAKEWKTVRMASEGAYAPFNFVGPDGELAGFDIDIGNALCEQMGVKCTWVKQDWDGMIPALMARKYDAIAASMSITDERKKSIDFSDKYYNTPIRLLARKDSGLDGSPAGLSGKRVGVQRETIHDRYATAVLEPAGAEIVRYGSADEANLDFVGGRLDARLDDTVILSESILKKPGGDAYAFVGEPISDPKWAGYGVGIGLRKQDSDLKDMFNKAIAAIRANGKYQEIQAKYFDFDVYGK